MFSKNISKVYFIRPTLTNNKINTISHLINAHIDIDNRKHYKDLISNPSEHLYQFFPKKTNIDIFFFCEQKENYIIPCHILQNIYLTKNKVPNNVFDSNESIATLIKNMIIEYISNEIIKGIILVVDIPKKEEKFINELESYLLEYLLFDTEEFSQEIIKNLKNSEDDIDVCLEVLSTFDFYDAYYGRENKPKYMTKAEQLFKNNEY